MHAPEFEDKELIAKYHEARKDNFSAPNTSVDILEIRVEPQTVPSWNRKLNHDALVEHLDAVDRFGNDRVEPQLRVLFMHRANIQNVTLNWLQDCYGLPSMFMHEVVNSAPWARIGPGYFTHYDDDDNPIRIDSFYRLALSTWSCQVWWAHEVASNSTTYLIFNALHNMKQRIVDCMQSASVSKLLKPLVIDSFLLARCSELYVGEVEKPRQTLLLYERYVNTELPDEAFPESFENLHRLSKKWHILHEDMIELEHLAEHLIKFSTTLSPLLPKPRATLMALDSLNYILSRQRTWTRWVANYTERTQIRINLFFHLSAQSENRTNLDIARMTKDIAVKARNDSASMITIAALTMLFLPGTFISAVFSMVFFDTDTDDNGNRHLVVMPQWWYFVAISLPLTVVIFSAWVVWQKFIWRNMKLISKLTNSSAANSSRSDRLTHSVEYTTTDNWSN